MNNLDWRTHAACRSVDPEIFFPPTSRGASLPKRICGTCPVLIECREDALAAGRTLVGIFGGLDEHERANVIRHRQRIARSMAAEAVALYWQIRPGVASNYAAHRQVADRFGVHYRTVDKWVAAAKETADA